MTTILSQAQNNSLLADGSVECINYTAFNTDRTTWIKRIDVVQRDLKSAYVIRIEQSDNIEYWYFSLKNERIQNNVLNADIDTTVVYNAYKNGGIDNQSHGTVISDRNTGIETLDFYFQAYGSKNHYVLKWKALPDSNRDSVHAYMYSRPFLTKEKIQPPLKEWKDEKAENLMDKLGYYPVAAWYLKGKNSNGQYTYNLDFSPTGEINFSYFIEKEYQNGRFLSDVAILRTGTFEIDDHTIEINFTKLLGSGYHRPNPWDDPLEENLTIKIEVECKEKELMVTQVSGTNIFENHPEQEVLKFTASILPPLEL
ncbi:MAG: hypothetical protein LBQ60_07085 [Bacteroidales bacterium]|nr:hypothetical protein [Bacteroidales bacterium]